VKGFRGARDHITAAAEYTACVEFNARNTIGTGYGRQTFPHIDDCVSSLG